MTRQLNNYLRTYRKRAGLSQDEMAFLLGCRSGTKVSRYERFARQPNLQTAFAYEVVFGAPARELFAGVYQQVERITTKRVHLLAQKLNANTLDRITVHKLNALRAITSEPATVPDKAS